MTTGHRSGRRLLAADGAAGRGHGLLRVGLHAESPVSGHIAQTLKAFTYFGFILDGQGEVRLTTDLLSVFLVADRALRIGRG